MKSFYSSLNQHLNIGLRRPNVCHWYTTETSPKSLTIMLIIYFRVGFLSELDCVKSNIKREIKRVKQDKGKSLLGLRASAALVFYSYMKNQYVGTHWVKLCWVSNHTYLRKSAIPFLYFVGSPRSPSGSGTEDPRTPAPASPTTHNHSGNSRWTFHQTLYFTSHQKQLRDCGWAATVQEEPAAPRLSGATAAPLRSRGPRYGRGP